MGSFRIEGLDDLMNEISSMEHEFKDFECPACGNVFDLDLDADTVTCPRCGGIIKIEKS